MLPNFLIIGAEKAGTTWLYDRLKHHPDIFMPEVKEIHYFNSRKSTLESNSHYEGHDLDWYRDFFRHRKKEKACGESTPMYLCDEHAPRRIAETLPHAKLIACLRYPVDRAYSHYWMSRGKGRESRSFEELVRQKDERFIRRGRYEIQLDRYLDVFDRSRLLILIHEEVFDAPAETLNRVGAFLDVNADFYQDQDWISGRVNVASEVYSPGLNSLFESVAHRMRQARFSSRILDGLKTLGLTERIKEANRESRSYPPMKPSLRHELDRFFAPTIEGVEALLGRPVDRWRDRRREAVSKEDT